MFILYFYISITIFNSNLGFITIIALKKMQVYVRFYICENKCLNNI